MDEKQDLEYRSAYQHSHTSYYRDMPNPRLSRSRRILIVLLALVLPAYALVRFLNAPGSITFMEESPEDYLAAQKYTSALVPLEAHVMSKCPDARDCLRDLVVPAMEKAADKVDFRLSFIGTIDADDGIRCMHGETECLGNMLSLCAHQLFPNNTRISLGFSTCLIMSYRRIPDRELVESCALEHGIEFEKLNACISDEGKGLGLLKDSVERSMNAGVKKSCTVRIGGEKWCIRDGGEWKECDGGHEVGDLVKEVKKRYGA